MRRSARKFFFHRPRPTFQTPIIVVAVALVVAIGVSRLYLGVHYFSVVVAAYAAGTVSLTVCLSGSELTARERVSPPIATVGARA